MNEWICSIDCIWRYDCPCMCSQTISLIEQIIALWIGNLQRRFLNIGHSKACPMLVYTEQLLSGKMSDASAWHKAREETETLFKSSKCLSVTRARHVYTCLSCKEGLLKGDSINILTCDKTQWKWAVFIFIEVKCTKPLTATAWLKKTKRANVWLHISPPFFLVVTVSPEAVKLWSRG